MKQIQEAAVRLILENKYKTYNKEALVKFNIETLQKGERTYE